MKKIILIAIVIIVIIIAFFIKTNYKIFNLGNNISKVALKKIIYLNKRF